MDRRVTLASGAAFLAYAGASLLWSSDPTWGAVYLGCLLVGLGLAFVDPRALWIICICLMITFVPFLWIEWPYAYFPFGNPNIFGAACALAIAGAFAYDFLSWLTVPALGVGIATCQSRGAIFAAGVAVLLGAWRESRIFGAICAVAAIGAIFFIRPDHGSSLYQRLGVWQDTSNHLWIFGHGLGAFFNDYGDFPIHTQATLIRANHVYNDILEILFTFGLGAIPLWFFLIGALEEADFRTWLIFLTFTALGLTYFPLFIFPLNSLLCATLFRAALQKDYYHGSLAPNGPALHQRSRLGVGV